MKYRKILCLMTLLLAILFISICCNNHGSSNSENTFLEGDNAYFGLKKPGLEPQLFAPGIVSTEDSIEFAGTFSPDGKEFYFTSRAPEKFNRLVYVRYENKTWTLPELAPFAIPMGDFEPSMTPDGKRIFFASARPLPGKTEYNMTPDIWFVDRDSSGWGTPKHFGDSMFYLSFTQDNVMYHYGTNSKRTSGFTCRKEKADSGYLERENLADKYDFFNEARHPCIAKNESYIIFDSDKLKPNFGQLDLYISFRQPDGSWNEPINLGDKINSNFTEMAPFLSPDNKYLFYSVWNEQKSDIFWVSTEIIEKLRVSIND